MVYNRKRHLELLERYDEFKNLGKVFHKEESENDEELSNYDAAICRYVQWQNRFKLISLMEEFLNETIRVEELRINSINELRINFFLLYQNLNNLTDKLISELSSKEFENFNPDCLPDIDFSYFILFLHDELEFSDLEDYYEHKTFYESIKKYLLDHQKVLDRTGGREGNLQKDEN